MSEIPLSEKLLNPRSKMTIDTKDGYRKVVMIDESVAEAAAQVCKAAEDWHAGQREAIEADRIGQTSPEFDARWSAAYRKIAKAEQALLAAVDAAVLAGGTPR